MKAFNDLIKPVRAISPVSVSDNTAQVSPDHRYPRVSRSGILDRHRLHRRCDATFAVTIQESDDSGMSGATDVASTNLDGTLAAAGFQYDDDNGPARSASRAHQALRAVDDYALGQHVRCAALVHRAPAPRARPRRPERVLTNSRGRSFVGPGCNLPTYPRDTMKVRLQTIYASQHVTAQPGSVIDVSDAEGKALIAGKFATAFVEPKSPSKHPPRLSQPEAPCPRKTPPRAQPVPNPPASATPPRLSQPKRPPSKASMSNVVVTTKIHRPAGHA